jgi:hypothetical protein
MIDQQFVVRPELNGTSDPLAMLRAKNECLENEEIERSLQQAGTGLISFLGRHSS